MFYSCVRDSSVEPFFYGDGEIAYTLERTNILLLDAERQEIDDFVARYGWEMQETGTGLRYDIYERGNGEKAESGKIALITFSIYLLNGDMIYSSKQEGPKHFRIGRGGVESGLEEGILLLSEGDKVRMIMPSHLAHGVPGDGARIPQRATIIYELELLDVI